MERPLSRPPGSLTSIGSLQRNNRHDAHHRRGIIPGSDTAHLSIFGYPPEQYYKGRGTFEALGVGIKLQHGDVAFRSNFATVDSNMNILDRRAGRIATEIGHELGKGSNGLKIDGVEIIFKPSVEHRATLVLRGKGLTNCITDTDPHGSGSVLDSKSISKDGKKTADILNKFTKLSYEILSKSSINKGRPIPANIVLSAEQASMCHANRSNSDSE